MGSSDLRGIIFSGLQNLGRNGLSVIGSVSKAVLEEKTQLESQPGPKKRTYVVDYVGNLGYRIGVATKSVGDRIVAQFLMLLRPNDEVMLYQFLNKYGHGRFIDTDGRVLSSVPPEEAVDRMLIEAYGLSHQPHYRIPEK